MSAAAGALGVLGALALAGALLLALAAFGAFGSGRSEVARSLAAMGGTVRCC